MLLLLVFFYLFVHLLLQHLGMTTQRSGIVIIMVLATVQLPMMMTKLIGRGFYGSFFRWSMSAAGSSSLRRSSFLFPPQHDHLLDMFGNMTQINLIRFKTAQHT